MKIAVWHNLPGGGGKRALYYHVRGLVKRGHEVEVWCPSTASETYLPLAPFVPEHRIPLKQNQQSDNSIRKLLQLYHSPATSIEYMETHCRQCAAEINAGNFDLLFANTCMEFYAPFIGRYVKGPKVLYLQEPCRRLYEAMPPAPGALPELGWIAPPTSLYPLPGQIKEFLLERLTLRSMRIQARAELINALTYDSILVNSFFSRESVLRAYGISGKVCYLGLDTELFKNRHQPREDFVLGIGSFNPVKNIEHVITAVANVEEPRPALVWLGHNVNPAYLASLKHLAESLRVDFQPQVQVSDAEILEFLNRASVLLCTPRLEPFGYTPLEANACGLPVIATAEGGLRETVIDGVNGIVVEYEAKSIAQAINRIRTDKDLARRLSENGQHLVREKWSLEVSIDRLENRLMEVMHQFQNQSSSHPAHAK